jgi:hypothetical protein
MGVNLNAFGVPDGQWFAGAWWGMRLPDRGLHMDLDLDRHTLSAAGRRGPIQVTRALLDSRDGDYTATLSFWEPTVAARGWQTPFIKVFDMQSRDGRVIQSVPLSTELTVVRLPPARDDARAPLPEMSSIVAAAP